MTQPERPAGHVRPMRWQAFRHAWDGLRVLVTTQPNARFHLGATLAVLGAGWFFDVSPLEWAVLVLTVTLVWLVEGLNTALEFLVDLVSPERRELAKWAKDVSAGAVLLASLGAVAVGLLVFGPRLWARVAG